MIENVLSNIGGIGIYGIISICIFFAFFLGTTIWMLLLKKPYINSMSELPLEDDAGEPKLKPTQKENRHE